ncbi:MAG: hypothetical protein P8L85_21055 [Rubripirellula sp.]|nr:hypothetical protein [Rubripirellula sp.]
MTTVPDSLMALRSQKSSAPIHCNDDSKLRNRPREYFVVEVRVEAQRFKGPVSVVVFTNLIGENSRAPDRRLNQIHQQALDQVTTSNVANASN